MRSYADRKDRKPPPPLDAAALERLALRYVERFATTRGKLGDYLRRKLRERGQSENIDPASIDTLVEKFAQIGYVDDAAWAGSKAGSLTRRGYGPRRVGDALRAAGIDPELANAVAPDEDEAWTAADTYARKRKIGAYGEGEADRDTKRKQLAAMIRAGHGFDVARRLVEAKASDHGLD
jgi:regulatory protein